MKCHLGQCTKTFSYSYNVFLCNLLLYAHLCNEDSGKTTSLLLHATATQVQEKTLHEIHDLGFKTFTSLFLPQWPNIGITQELRSLFLPQCQLYIELPLMTARAVAIKQIRRFKVSLCLINISANLENVTTGKANIKCRQSLITLAVTLKSQDCQQRHSQHQICSSISLLLPQTFDSYCQAHHIHQAPDLQASFVLIDIMI